MTPQQISAIELAVDQARDAGVVYMAALQSLTVQVNGCDPPARAPLARAAAIAVTNAETSVLWLRDAEDLSRKLRCARMPCDRQDGICPRCFPETL